ncbi:unnamed protein product [Rhodiola kirilowii]
MALTFGENRVWEGEPRLLGATCSDGSSSPCVMCSSSSQASLLLQKQLKVGWIEYL